MTSSTARWLSLLVLSLAGTACAVEGQDPADTGDADEALRGKTSAPSPGSTPSTDPFDATSCAGPTWSKAEALARIARGETKVDLGTVQVAVRKRTCTGDLSCTAWMPSNVKPYWYSLVDQWGARPALGFVSIAETGSSLARLRMVGGSARLYLGYLLDEKGIGIDIPFDGRKEFGRPITDLGNRKFSKPEAGKAAVGTCHRHECPTFSAWQGGLGNVKITATATCTRIEEDVFSTPPRGETHDEYQTVFLARY